MILFWNVTGAMNRELDIVLRWILLPVLLFVATVTNAKNNYFGKGKWFCILGTAITFLTVPYTQFVYIHETETATFTFKFLNIYDSRYIDSCLRFGYRDYMEKKGD